MSIRRRNSDTVLNFEIISNKHFESVRHPDSNWHCQFSTHVITQCQIIVQTSQKWMHFSCENGSSRTPAFPLCIMYNTRYEILIEKQNKHSELRREVSISGETFIAIAHD